MKEQKERNGKRIAERICEKLDISADSLFLSHKVEIFGRSAISVSGCRGIVLYAPCEIRLALADSTLCVVGKDLVCVAYSVGEVSIEGRIDNVIFKEA